MVISPCLTLRPAKLILSSFADEERADLEIIRQTYLPDIVLGYISVLRFGGSHLSREILLQIMNLAVLIAGPSDSIDKSKDNCEGVSEVCATFQKAGRMTQLMDTLAASSVAIMRADEVARGKGKGKKSRKSGAGGENMDIWNVVVPEI